LTAVANFLRYHDLTLRVQLDLPFLVVPAIEPARSGFTVEFVRIRRARRYIVRVGHDGSVRVTIPRGGSRAEATRFLDGQGKWIEKERARVLAAHVTPSWTDGAMMMLRGELVTLQVRRDAHGSMSILYGDRVVALSRHDSSIRGCVEADLRALARNEIGARLDELAAAHNLIVSRFTIRNQRSRWGSCSRGGRIALNYRLVQMPRTVSDYVILHELMHLKEQNHSRRFWRLVERACPDFRNAERWLRRYGPGLL
jgi:predicted metal-dependent hydrolase